MNQCADMRGKTPKTIEHRKKISLALMGRETKPAIERFMDKVIIQENDCWDWIGATKPKGYGMFTIKKNGIQKTFNAHRWAYINLIGEIPPDLCIDHLCRNRRCVNPKHMEVVTLKENLARGNSPSTFFARRTYCKNGHQLIPCNWPSLKKPQRYCPICVIARAKQWNLENREKHLASKRKSYFKKKNLHHPSPEIGALGETGT